MVKAANQIPSGPGCEDWCICKCGMHLLVLLRLLRVLI